MASTVDSQLRAALTESGVEERVEVNQRHLIDKILARYSAEFTVFRELIQNSNDAMAKHVEICFECPTATVAPPGRTSPTTSTPSRPQNMTMTSVVYKNDGRVFQEEDWRRLKSIAEGNPDDTKIGYFGVGFYSLFSVSSGDACLGFFWKGDQLYCKRAQIPDSIPAEERKWTTFSMQLREPMELPNTSDFGRFLATSLSFTESLQQVTVTRNGETIISISKASAPPRTLDIPQHLHRESPQRLFKLRSVELRQVQMEAEVLIEEFPEQEKPSSFRLLSFFGGGGSTPKPPPQPRIERVKATLFFRIARAYLDVSLNPRMGAQMERTTKKRAPLKTSIQMIYNNYDERDASVRMKSKCEVFNDLVPFPEQGRVFIGFPTHQTTGCSIHLAGHLIPTVERENIDFVDPTLNIWNQEILCMGGLLARFTYDQELDAVSEMYKSIMGAQRNGDASSDEENRWLVAKCVHILKSFSFRQSTPAALVQQVIASHFFRCSRQDLSVYSSHGILPATQVRMPLAEVKDFIKSTPVLSDEMAKECPDYVHLLQRAGMLKEISVEDVLIEISGRQLSPNETVSVVKWWTRLCRNPEAVTAYGTSFRQALKVPCGSSVDKLVPLASLRYYAPARVFPPDVPVPEDVLSVALSKSLNDQELAALGVLEYNLADWSVFVAKDSQLTADAEFSQRIFNVLSRALPHMSAQTKAAVASVFQDRACLPTTQGMRKPTESYFGTVTLFNDLPVVKMEQFPNPRAVTEKLLSLIGVREHVDLQMVFDRLDSLQWDHQHLLKYLTTVQDKLNESEIGKLKNAAIFPAAPQPGGTASAARYRACDLYTPTEELKAYPVPLLDMGGKHWRASLPECQLLLRLGIRTHLPLDFIIDQCSKAGFPVADRVKLIEYFANNFTSTYHNLYRSRDIRRPFVPNTQGGVSRPLELFSDTDCAVMGFDVLVPALKPHADKLGVRANPSGLELCERLANTPPGIDSGAGVFAFLAGKQREFSRADFARLYGTKFVPVRREGSAAVTHVEPSRAFFAGAGASPAFASLFDYVDFGSTGNLFLRSCGVKDEPSPAELAQMLVSDQQHVLFDKLDVEQYLDILRKLAVNWNQLTKQPGLLAQMQKAKFLIGVSMTPSLQSSSETLTDGKTNGAVQAAGKDAKTDVGNCRLASAGEIYLIDDPVLQNIFRPLSAPVDPLIESMYEALGSQWISASVQSHYRVLGKAAVTPKATQLEALLRERGPLLIYDAGSISSHVAPGALKTLESMRVVQADNVEIVRKFQSRTDTQLTSACLTKGGDSFGFRASYTMVIANGEIDYFDVARGLSDVLFKKPKLNDALLISTMLSTSLDNLRRKGFPVDRILKIAPAALQLKSIPPPPIATPSKPATPQQPSPVPVSANAAQTKSSQGTVQPRPLSQAPKELPPPSMQQQQQQQQQQTQQRQQPSQQRDETSQRSQGQLREIDPAFKDSLKQDLISSIKSCASNSSAVIRSSPSVTTLSNTTYCDVRHNHDLVYHSTVSDVQIFLDRQLSPAVLADKTPGLSSFAALLKVVGSVYGVNANGIHIYYDDSAETVAFNRGRTLFFNVRFYLSLHWSSQLAAATPVKSEAYTYWYMVFAHELGHNHAPNHDSTHEFYMSSYADTYMVKLMVMLLGMGIDLAALLQVENVQLNRSLASKSLVIDKLTRRVRRLTTALERAEDTMSHVSRQLDAQLAGQQQLQRNHQQLTRDYAHMSYQLQQLHNRNEFLHAALARCRQEQEDQSDEAGAKPQQSDQATQCSDDVGDVDPAERERLHAMLRERELAIVAYAQQCRLLKQHILRSKPPTGQDTCEKREEPSVVMDALDAQIQAYSCAR
ncbi:hypothetical protein RI367_000453 [Sorochytrium milnesiophthora]